MLRRLTALLVLTVLLLGYLPGSRSMCGNPAPISGAVLLSADASPLGPCGQAMTLQQCPAGQCATLPQRLVAFSESPATPTVIEFTNRLHGHTPRSPEPPPPQA